MPGLFHFELENAEGVFAQAPDLGKGETQAAYEFNIAQGFGNDAGHAVGLAVDGALEGFHFAAQHAGKGSEYEYTDDKYGDEGLMFGDGIPDEKPHTYQGGEQNINKRGDKPFGVGAYFLEDGHGLPTALFFVFIEGKAEGLAEAVINICIPNF